MKKLMVLLALTAGSALAANDVYVSNTVSYNLSKTDEGVNSSTVYVDEVNDTTNKTFVGFQCDEGKPYFYLVSKNTLVTTQMYKTNTYPTLTYRVDSQTARSLPTQSWGEGEDFDGTRLLVSDEADPVMLAAFKNAKSKVVLRVARPNLSELVYTFPTKGFAEGLKKINNCK